MPLEQCSNWLCAAFVVVMAALHPWAAVGAGFGCCFFMAYPPRKTTYLARTALTAFSWGFGYASGVWFYPSGPPYDPSAMLPAVALSALAVVLGLVAVKMMEQNSGLPEWLKDVLGVLPLTKGKGDNNGL